MDIGGEYFQHGSGGGERAYKDLEDKYITLRDDHLLLKKDLAAKDGDLKKCVTAAWAISAPRGCTSGGLCF